MQRPSLVTKRWRGGDKRGGEQDVLTCRPRLLDLAVMVEDRFQSMEVNVGMILGEKKDKRRNICYVCYIKCMVKLEEQISTHKIA